MMTITEKLMKGYDLREPDWWIKYANEVDLQDCVRMCTDGYSGTIRAKEHLRFKTATRMLSAVGAAIEGELVVMKP